MYATDACSLVCNHNSSNIVCVSNLQSQHIKKNKYITKKKHITNANNIVSYIFEMPLAAEVDRI